MSDFDSSLPVRTQNNGDVVSRISDGTVTSQLLVVNADGSIDARLNDGAGNNITSTTAGAKKAVDVLLSDAAGGVLGTTSSPMVVSMAADPNGDEINSYNTAASVAALSSSNHTYTVTAGKKLKLNQIECSGSGKIKVEIQVETGVASGIYTTKFVQFNSTANPNTSIRLLSPIAVAAGVNVRVIRTNRDLLPQDLYSAISGVEV